MISESDRHDWRGRKLQEWLLLLLRYAVTREPSDQAAVLAMANWLDALGGHWRRAAPTFFLRTSEDVCAAIVSSGCAHSKAVLRQHVARIPEPRLRQAFEAALGERASSERRSGRTKTRRNQDLFRGLPAR